MLNKPLWRNEEVMKKEKLIINMGIHLVTKYT